MRDFFPAHGVRFISVDDRIDSVLLDGFNKTMAIVKSIFSERYSHDISIKTRSALDAQRRQGNYIGSTPIYGYQRSPENKHKLIPDSETYSVVKSIYHMKLQGMSAAKIAAYLNKSSILSPLAYKRKQGLPYPTKGFADKPNACWSATTVLRILRDETYTGTLVQGRQRTLNYKTKNLMSLDENEWIRAENSHQPIVSQIDYNTVQRTFEIDTRTPPRHCKVQIFSGMLICGSCGSHMTRKTVRRHRGTDIYYYCPTGKANGCQTPCTIEENFLMELVIARIRARITDIQKIKPDICEMRIRCTMQSDYIQHIADHNEKIRRLIEFSAHLYDCLTNGLIDNTEYQTLHYAYHEEIARLKTDLQALENKLYDVRKFPSKLFTWQQNFLPFADQEKLDRQAVVTMVQNICVVSQQDIVVQFVGQAEYEQAVQYLGGCTVGTKKSKTE